MTESLKNLITSVDWKKMLSSQDAKNALVGSALGGLMLGGASLASDRDPDESKWTPVGDALLGALLGGAAGYGIPKGLALFRDSGTLAPDNDQIADTLGARLGRGAAFGGAIGAGGITASLVPTHLRAIYRRLRDAGEIQTSGVIPESIGNEAFVERHNLASPFLDVRKAARYKQLKAIANQQKGLVLGEEFTNYRDAVKSLKGWRRRTSGDDRKLIEEYLKYLRDQRKIYRYGMSGYGDVLREISSERPAPPPTTGWFKGTRNWLNNFTNGSHYRPRPLGPLRPHPVTKMGGRAALWAAILAAAGATVNGVFGNSARDNFKN